MLTPWKFNKNPTQIFSSKIGAGKGILVIEILVVIFIISVGLVGLLGAMVFSLKFASSQKETIQANFLVQELMETARNFRDGTNWSSNGLGALTLDTAYHPQKTAGSPPAWSLVLGEENSDGFSRNIIFKKVFRDSNDNIVPSGAEDQNTKKAIATVSWKDKKVEITSYLTNWISE